MNRIEKWLMKETPDGPKPDIWKVACLLLAIAVLMVLLFGFRGGEKHTIEKIEIRTNAEKTKVELRPREEVALAKNVAPRKEASEELTAGNLGGPPVKEEEPKVELVKEERKEPIRFQKPKDEVGANELQKALQAMPKPNGIQPNVYTPPPTCPMAWEIEEQGWDSISMERRALATAACRDELRTLHKWCDKVQKEAQERNYCVHNRNKVRLMAQLKSELNSCTHKGKR
jgi:hypothetical protein